MAVKTEPVRNVQIEGFSRDFQVQVTNFEEALLKNDAKNLLAQQGLSVGGLQRRRDIISSVHANEILGIRYVRESEEVEGTVDGIYCEKSFVRGAAHIVLNAIEPVG